MFALAESDEFDNVYSKLMVAVQRELGASRKWKLYLLSQINTIDGSRMYLQRRL
jgi:hypothetical protein